MDNNTEMDIDSTMDVDPIQPLFNGVSTLSVNERPESTTPKTTLLGLSDMPPEVRNQIYAKCKFFFIDVSQPRDPPIFRGNSTLTRELSDYYYSDNTFMLSTRMNLADRTYNDRYARCLELFHHWSSRLSDRHAGMVQHLRIVTIKFTATVHIPPAPKSTASGKSITVSFGRTTDCNYPDCAINTLANRIDAFHPELAKFNDQFFAGRRLNAEDLDRLVSGILEVAPCSCSNART